MIQETSTGMFMTSELIQNSSGTTMSSKIFKESLKLTAPFDAHAPINPSFLIVNKTVQKGRKYVSDLVVFSSI